MNQTIIPLQLSRRGARRVDAADRRYDPILINAIGKAYYWQNQIQQGRAESGADIARQEQLHPTTVNALLRLVLLAPDIVEDIYYGRQPRTLTLQWLKKHRLPNDWDEQRHIISRFL